jgi:membrane-bound serine protease (ClpP class)
LIAISLHFATKHSRLLDSPSADAYGLYLVHYNFVVRLQYALLDAALFAAIKAAIVFGGTLVLSWIAALAVQRIPFGAQLIGARDERSQRRNRLARRARATKIRYARDAYVLRHRGRRPGKIAMMRLRAVIVLLAMLFATLLLATQLLATLAVPARAAERAVVLDIDGAIGPAVADYVMRELRAATPGDVGVVVLRMNTPGGLDTSMRQIITAILASPVPVVTYVAPSGARAASAGTYIAYASAIAAMAPGTNIGAATPVALGGPMLPGGGAEQKQSQQNKADESGDTETRKIVNDAIAYIRSLATLNGRNADWAADAVRSAVSLPAADALSLHVVDVIADDVPDLLRQIDGRTVKVAGKPERLATAGLDVTTVPPDWRTELLALVTNPNVAFILLLIGVYGLILEFFNPGAVAPGLIGIISLFVALYALALLPVNYAGAALVLIGIGLMIAEAHIGAFGAIGVGGVAAFVIGALMMFPSRAPGFALSYAVVVGTAICSAALFLLALAVLLRSRKRPVVTGREALIGAAGEAVSWQGGEGRVRVKGEIWLARADTPLAVGTHVKVLDRDGLVLRVQPL